MKTIQNFTHKYPLSKMLRFKLIPIGETMQNLLKSGIIEEDKHRAESYIKVKQIIDNYHKTYIEDTLSEFELPVISNGKLNSLEEYFMYHNIRKKSEKEQDTFKKIQSNLRKQIVNQLTKSEKYKRIDKKELIQKDLIEFVKNDSDAKEKQELISEFQNFTVYFSGFHENRKNMYSDEEQSTAIAYRLIHENLPKFIDNMQIFSLIQNTDIADKLTIIPKSFDNLLKGKSLNEVFNNISFFNKLLSQKYITVYNGIISGITLQDGTKVQGLNEYINLYNQVNKQEKLPKFKMLFKQILSDRESISWLPEKFQDGNQVITAIKKFYNQLIEFTLKEDGLKQLLKQLPQYDLEGIYLKNDSQQLKDISQKMTGNWSILSNSIKEKLKENVTRKKKESEENFQQRVDKLLKSYSSYSFAFINECLANAGYKEITIEQYIHQLGATNTDNLQKENLFARISNAYTDVKGILEKKYDQQSLLQDKDAIQKIKLLLDSIKELQAFIKPLLGSGEESNKDEHFYGEFIEYWNELNLVTSLYNMVRNYVTQKPYSEEKIKLNFQNPTLLDGWDLNKETDNCSVILRRNNMYYLAIIDKKHKKVFTDYPMGDKESCYEKMEYKFKKYRDLYHVFFSEKRKEEFTPSKHILKIKEKKSYKKGDNFSLNDCHQLIDFFKTSIQKHEDWKQFGFQFSETSSYTNINEFYREVDNQAYRLAFKPIDATYIDRLVKEGKIYLFKIYNKDFSEHSTGTPNMHTLYWKALFDERNLQNVVYKLNGQAEIFFRKASIRFTQPTHPANVAIKNKNPLNKNKERILKYDLIKDKRYTVDQFQLHVPITLNFKSNGNGNINQEVNEYLKTAENLHIIGIDRGERHLLYLVVMDMKGNICEQFSLNQIVAEYNGKKSITDYHSLLEDKERERAQARQSWQSIANIKNLKEGYLSQVIHKISELMIKYNAIVVLEDLNSGFIRGRQKVERQVYQNFEKMLIDKLNYLVFKKQMPDISGGVLHAYQLANKFESFNKLGKQSGFLFYIPAWNTSKIDPITGFVNLFSIKYESIEKAKTFFCKFDSIKYNTEKDWFEWKFNYRNFTQKAEGAREQWTLCTFGNRIKSFRNSNKNSQWDYEEVNLTENFKALFKQYNIDITGNIKEEMTSIQSKEFFENLIGLFKLTIQMRNSIGGTDIDYLISPVADKQGVFFDSRNNNEKLPENADANGAYHIAKKGLMLVERIKEANDLRKINFAISNKEWMNFVQQNNIE